MKGSGPTFVRVSKIIFFILDFYLSNFRNKIKNFDGLKVWHKPNSKYSIIYCLVFLRNIIMRVVWDVNSLLASHWSRVITWPGYWPLIGHSGATTDIQTSRQKASVHKIQFPSPCSLFVCNFICTRLDFFSCEEDEDHIMGEYSSKKSL